MPFAERQRHLRQLMLLTSPAWRALSMALLAAPTAWAQTAPAAPTAPAPAPARAVAQDQLPQGGKVVGGQAKIHADPAAAKLQVQQATQRAVIDWTTFNIGEKAEVQFQQPGRDSATLNRVLDSEASRILGKITAPGQVFVLNPNGVLFGSTARVDVGGLVASSMSLDPQRFMLGSHVLERLGATGAVVNEGELRAKLGGYIALLAPEVRNDGVIVATAGTVALAAGDAVTLDLGLGGALAGVRVTPATVNTLVDNRLAVRAEGGLVILSARAAQGLIGQVVNAGQIDATQLVDRGGRIWLEGDSIALKDGSTLEARGATGGGEVLVGGGWQGSGPLAQATQVEAAAASRIDVSATQQGDGGTAVLWTKLSDAQAQTTAAGTILARGGAQGGNGGRIETSGARVATQGLRVDASAPKGNGGLWLLDPFNYTIGTNEATTISNALGSQTSVEISTDNATSIAGYTPPSGTGVITVNAPITKTAGADATLTLKAADSIVINSGISSTAGKLNVVLWSDSDGSGQGAIAITGATINTKDGHFTAGGGAGGPTGAARSATGYATALRLSNSTVINAGAGDIRLTGTGTATNAHYAGGVSVHTSTLKGANIDIVGVGSASSASYNNHMGVEVSNATLTAGAGIKITGTGGGSASGGGNNHGIFMQGAITNMSAGTDITLVGTGGGGSGTDASNNGIFVSGGITAPFSVGAGRTLEMTGTAGTAFSVHTNALRLASAISIDGHLKAIATGPLYAPVDLTVGVVGSNSGRSMLLKTTDTIDNGSGRSWTTSGGNLTLWADSDSSGSGRITLDSNTTLRSNGGHITLGGGAPMASDPNRPGGFAVNSTVGTEAAGVMLGTPNTTQTTLIETGGGDLTIRGRSTVGAAQGIAQVNSGTFDAGAGKIVMVGESTGGYGVELSAWTQGTLKLSSGSVSLTGTTTTTDSGFSGLRIKNGTLTATSKTDPVTLKGYASKIGNAMMGVYLDTFTITAPGAVLLEGDGVRTDGFIDASGADAGGGGITLRSTRQILTYGTKTFGTNGGDVRLIANSSGKTDGNGGIVVYGLTVNSKGGDILLAGGDANGTGYATGDGIYNAEHNHRAGIRFHGIGSSLNSEGGDITLRGAAGTYDWPDNTAYAAWGVGSWSTAPVSLNSGAGKIVIDGKSTAARGIDDWGSAVAFHGTLTSTSANTTADAIKITGDATGAPNGAAGASSGVALHSGGNLIAATEAGGGITIEGKRGAATDDLYIVGGNILAKSGAIKLFGQSASGTVRLSASSNAWTVGAKDGSTVTSSSSDITVRGDKLAWNAAVGSFNTTGAFVAEPVSASFADTVLTSLFQLNTRNTTTSNLVKSIRIGKDLPGQSYLLRADAPLSAAGTIEGYAQQVITLNPITSRTSGSGITFKGRTSIDIGAALTTEGGPITLWSNSDGLGAGHIKLNDPARLDSRTAADRAAGTHTTGGGAITIGGGLDLATGFAQGTDMPGVIFGYGYATPANTGIQLLSGGGNITVRGRATTAFRDAASTVVATTGIAAKEGLTVNAGRTGSIRFVGVAENPTLTLAGVGLDMAAFRNGSGGTAATDFLTVNGDITLTGTTTSTAASAVGVRLQAGSSAANRIAVAATGSGKLSVTGAVGGTGTGFDVVLNNAWLQSGSGSVQVTAQRSLGASAGGIQFGANGVVLGHQPGTPVTNSSANLTLTSDKFNFATTTAKLKVGSDGALTVEPYSTSFPSAFTWPWSVDNYGVYDSIGGLTLGKPDNTADITVSTAQSVFGPVNIYAGTAKLDANIKAVGDVLVKASADIVQAAGTSVSTKNGSILYWADADGSNGGGIRVNGTAANPASISTTGTGSITLAGGLAAAGGLLPGGSASGVTGTTAGVQLDFATVRAADHVTVRGSSVADTAGVGVRLRGGTLEGKELTVTGSGSAGLASGSGNIGLLIEQGHILSGSSTVALTGTGGGTKSTGGGDYGVLLQSAGTAVGSTGAGHLTITGTGTGSGINSGGVLLLDGAAVTASGAGNLSVTGTAKATSTAAGNHGVVLRGGSTRVAHSGSGATAITGTSSAGAAGLDTYGVLIEDGRATPDSATAPTVTASSGTLAITGSAVPGSSAQDAVGLRLAGVTVDGTGGKTVTLQGTGGSATRSARGVEVVDSKVGSGATGLITLDATAGTGGTATGALQLQRSSVGGSGQTAGITFKGKSGSFDAATATTIGVLTWDGSAAGFAANAFAWEAEPALGGLDLQGRGALAGLTMTGAAAADWAGGLAILGKATDTVTLNSPIQAGSLVHLKAGTLNVTQSIQTTTAGTGTVVLDAMDGSLNTDLNPLHTANLLLRNIPSVAYGTQSNSVGRLAGDRLGTVDVHSTKTMQVGTLTAGSSPIKGLTATGTVTLSSGPYADINVVDPITTTDTSASAILLKSGDGLPAGFSSRAQVNVAANGLVTGDGGRALVYTGSVAGSSIDASVVAPGSGRFRYNSTPLVSNFTTPLAATGASVIYREGVAANIAVGSTTTTYGTVPSYNHTATGLVNGDLPGFAMAGRVNSGAGHLAVGSYTTDVDGTLAALGYSVTSTPGTVTVNPLALNLSGFTADGKVYDGSTTAAIRNAGSLASVFTGDTVGFTHTGASFADKNVAAGKTVTLAGLTLTGADAANYSLPATATTTAGITARPLALTLTAPSKVYDGGTSATVSIADDRIANDDLTLTANAAFETKDAGTGKIVHVTGIAATGADTANYSIETTGTTYTTITPRALALTFTGTDKVYDGNTVAAFTATDDRLSGDRFTLQGVASFADKAVGTAKTVSLSALALTGTDAHNYALAANTASTTAAITARTLTATFGAQDKVYDGSTFAALVFGDDRLAGDVLSLAGSGAFADKNVGTGKAVAVSGVTLAGADAGNYTLASSTGAATASITPRVLNATFAAADKVYDQTTTATISLGSDDRVSGDALSASATGRFADKNAGSGKAVHITGATLAGADAGNYTLSALPYAVAAITPRPLTVTHSAANKVYDGTVAAQVTTTDDRLAGDALTLTGTGAFADKNVGTAKTVTLTGLMLGGADAGNYRFDPVAASTTTADITARALTGQYTAASKVYDGSTTASVTTGDNRVAGDSLSLSATGRFADKHAGTAKTVTVAATLAGADAANYTLANPSATTQADITPRTLNASYSAQSKVYDGGTAATIAVGDDRIVGDAITLSATGQFADKNVGSGKAVSVSGLSLAGADAGNYSLASILGSTTASITPRTLSLGFTAADKAYDGTTTAQFSVSDDRVAGDVLSYGGTAAFADKNVGSGKTVTLSGVVLAGADAANYVLATNAGSATAAITPRALNLVFSASGKVYDGSTLATVTVADDRLPGDLLSFTPTAHFTDKHAGTAKPVTISAVTLAGADAANYSLAATTGSSSADITPRPLALAFQGLDKVYDGNTTATVSTTDNRLAGDQLSVATTATFADKHAGTGKTVQIGSVQLSGSDAGNYSAASTGQTTAAITPRNLAIGYRADDKVYDGTTAVRVTAQDDRVSGDLIAIAQDAAFADKNVGTGKAVTVRNVALSGPDALNYTAVVDPATTATITAKPVTLAGASGVSKVYDGGSALPASESGHGSVVGLIAGDSVTIDGRALFDAPGAGARRIVQGTVALGGTDAGNYALGWQDGSGTIQRAPLVVRARDDARLIAQADPAHFNGVTVTGLVGGESEAVLGGTASVVRSNAGVNSAGRYTDVLIPSGLTAANYDIRFEPGHYTIVGASELLVRANNLASPYGSAPVYTVASAQYMDGNNVVHTLAAPTVNGNTFTFDDGLGGSATFTLQAAAGGATPSGAGQLPVGRYALVPTQVSGQSANFSNTLNVVGELSVNTRALQIGAAGLTKVYDGSTAMNGLSLQAQGVLNGDRVTAAGNGAFASRNVGTGLAYSVSGLALAGADATNYHLAGGDQLSGNDGSITPRALAISGITARDKVYDGTRSAVTDASAAVYSGRVAGDSVNATATGLFADKQAGTAKTVDLTLALSGADVGNYTVTPQATTQASITPRTLVVTGLAAQAKVYDGTQAAVLDATGAQLQGLVAGDTVVASSSAQFADKNAGLGKAVTLRTQISGADAGNYTLQGQAQTVGDITPRPLALAFSAADKVYDGSRATTAQASDDRIAGDQLTVTASASFADAQVGSAKPVSISSITIGGADAGNYVAGGNATAQASITPRLLTVTVSGQSKVYDGNTVAPTTTQDDRVAGDALTLVVPAHFADANVGTAKPITVGQVQLGGAHAGNYTLSVRAATAADITRLAESTWIGGTTGLWSDPANWANGAVPSLANVAGVVIPAGVNVVFDASASTAGAVQVDRIGTAGGLTQTGGQLNVAQQLELARLEQSGGSLSGNGSVTVTQQFAQSGTGSIAVGGDVRITQANGPLNLTQIAGQAVVLTATQGSIQGGSVQAQTLTAQAAQGDIRLDGVQQVSGATTLNAGGAVQMANPANALGGPVGVQAASANLAAQNLQLGSVRLSADLTAQATQGPLTQAAGTHVEVGGATQLTAQKNGAPAPIQLPSTGNRFAQTPTLNGSSTQVNGTGAGNGSAVERLAEPGLQLGLQLGLRSGLQAARDSGALAGAATAVLRNGPPATGLRDGFRTLGLYTELLALPKAGVPGKLAIVAAVPPVGDWVIELPAELADALDRWDAAQAAEGWRLSWAGGAAARNDGNATDNVLDAAAPLLQRKPWRLRLAPGQRAEGLRQLTLHAGSIHVLDIEIRPWGPAALPSTAANDGDAAARVRSGNGG